MLELILRTDNLIMIGMVAVLLYLSSFFSGSETALTAASKARIHNLEKNGDKRAIIVAKLLNSRERLLGGILLGNNLVNILASVLTTAIFTNILGGGGLALMSATIVMTLLILIFAEVLPKSYAISQPDSLALKVAVRVNFIVRVFAPMVLIIQIIVNGTLRLFGVNSNSGSWSAEEAIKGAVDLHLEEGGVAKRARDQIYGVLEIGELSVEEVMIHRKNVCMIDINIPPKEIIKEVLNSGHSRVPLYENGQDNIIGVLHVKDILKSISNAEVVLSEINTREIMRSTWFVPETTSLVKQLKAFQQKREHFAVVVDEYGALMGIVTLEDILEEIVGDIQDEYDEEITGINKLKEGGAILRGNLTVRDVNRAMGWGLPDEEAVTIAGLVIYESQTIPEVNQTFSYHGYRFEVIKKQRNQIISLKVNKIYE
jgi:Mg2+/Co2+ transporter CorB